MHDFRIQESKSSIVTAVNHLGGRDVEPLADARGGGEGPRRVRMLVTGDRLRLPALLTGAETLRDARRCTGTTSGYSPKRIKGGTLWPLMSQKTSAA